jgi:hypothetical protein
VVLFLPMESQRRSRDLFCWLRGTNFVVKNSVLGSLRLRAFRAQ